MKRVFIIFAIIFCATALFAQDVTISQLKNKSWIEMYPNISYRKSQICFSDKEFIETSTYLVGNTNGKTIINRNKYYLSSYKPKYFNDSLVGKDTKGKYLIVKLQDKYLYVFEIISITENELTIKFNNDICFKYKKQ